MPRIPAAEVSCEVLDSLFNEFDIWSKIDDGRLTSKPVALAPSSKWLNATSMIIKHFLPNGKHIATTHCVKDDKEHVLHRDAKDFRLHEVCLYRAASSVSSPT